MLASITPLGERARGSRFWLTAGFFVGASVVAPAALGALLGGIGSDAPRRGWVYGAGFGGQLGVGVATIVTTSLVYATLIAAFLSAAVWSGALIAGAGGAARGLT